MKSGDKLTLDRLRGIWEELIEWHEPWEFSVIILPDGIALRASDGSDTFEAASERELLRKIRKSWASAYAIKDMDAEQRGNIKRTLGVLKRHIMERSNGPN